MNAQTLWQDCTLIRERAPLVHSITNYVVMNSTANAVLALGGSPVMAHATEEMPDMVALTKAVGGALVINIGTLSPAWIDGMAAAMTAARQQGVPIVFDPVGAGATPYRTQTCTELLTRNPATIIRGNASEIMALHDASRQTKGVDSHQTADAARDAAAALAKAYDCVVSVSGPTDLITNGTDACTVPYGHPLMPRVTGLGCTASALTGAFAAVNPDPLVAAHHAMTVMGICGAIAGDQAAGPGSLQMHFLDALHNLDEATLVARLG